MKYKMVVFDLDGTLLDTLEDLYIATNHTMRVFGFPEKDRMTVRKTVGNGIHRLIEIFFPEGSSGEFIEKGYREFNEFYFPHCRENTRPYEGIQELIDRLRADGYLISVVSNKVDNAVQDLCRLYFDGKYDYAVGNREDVRRKPYPDAVNAILDKYGLTADEAVYVGDSEVDVKTAENAHTDCISVSWGFRDRALLESLNPGKVVDTMDELLSMIENA